MADKKISELDQVLQINNDAAIPMSQDSGGTPTTYKAYITQIGAEIAEDQTFSNLQTTSKNLVGAINEVAQGGGGGGSSNANLAPDYDATSTYAVGDWCIYNGTLYQCNTAISTAEAFDPTHWTAKKVVDELDDKVDTSDFLATNLPIESGSATNTKDYIDSGLSGKADSTTVNDAFATIGDIKVSTLSAGNKTIGDIQTWAKSEGKGLFWGTVYMTSPFAGWGVYWVYNRIVASAYSEIIIFQNDHIVTSFTQNLDSTTPTWTTKSGSLA